MQGSGKDSSDIKKASTLIEHLLSRVIGMTSFNIGSAIIDKNEDYCYIIAEAGSNHDQNKKNAFELIEIAAEVGADAVKFQLFDAESLYSKYVGKEIFEGTRRASMPLDWIPEILDNCKANKITFLATPFDYKSVDYIDEFGVPAFKWASGEITDLKLLAHAAAKGKPIVISTGMCNLAEIEAAVDVIESKRNMSIAILHCISLYPTEAKQANLRMMDSIAEAFGYPVGFSDHTLGMAVSFAAIARGAKILEKHFTLDKKLKSPDHPFSLRPKELRELIKGAREIALSLGDRRKRMIIEEVPVARIAKRSLISNRAIRKGTRITESMLIAKRPGTGIRPSLLPLVIGRETRADIAEDEILTWDKLS